MLEAQARRSRQSRLTVKLASTPHEVRQAQRLRWQVFGEEQGARIDTPHAGFDIDDLDDFCEHLIVVDEASAAVVGTYRMLTAEAAQRAGGYYSEREFDLRGLRQPGIRLLELGRSCIAPAHRTGATIALLWSGLADFLIVTGHDALIGCASIPLDEDPAGVAWLAAELFRLHAAPPPLRAASRRPMPFTARIAAAPVPLPPLLKGYLRSGAVVCAEPYWDSDFNCADLLLHLDVGRLTARYARRFMPERQRSAAQGPAAALHPASF